MAARAASINTSWRGGDDAGSARSVRSAAAA